MVILNFSFTLAKVPKHFVAFWFRKCTEIQIRRKFKKKNRQSSSKFVYIRLRGVSEDTFFSQRVTLKHECG